MKSKTVLFFLFLFKYIIAEADYTHTVDKTINEFRIQYMNYSFYQRERYEISWEIILPPRDFDNFYVIFDYYIHDEYNNIKSTVDVLGIKKEEFRNKIVAKVETKDANYKQGVELVLKQLKDVLKSKGIEEIKTIGETFDPELHEAVSSIQDENLGEKEIAQEYRKGYKIGSRVIRHSMVVVAN